MQPGPSWSSQRCRVLRESSQASSPSLTSPPLRDSIVPSLQESCFLFPVSLSLPVTYRPTRVNWQKSSKLVCLIYFSSSTLRSACYGNLHRRDGELPWEAFWWLAFLMVLHSGLGCSAHDLFCWSVTFFFWSDFQHVLFDLMERVCFVLQVYFTCVPTGCMNAEEWPALAKTKEKQTLCLNMYIYRCSVNRSHLKSINKSCLKDTSSSAGFPDFFSLYHNHAHLR